MLVQDAGEIPIGLCVYDKTLTWWLSAVLILSLLTVGVQVMFMLLGTLGNGGPGDGGGSGRGLIPYPPDPTPLASRISSSKSSMRTEQASRPAQVPARGVHQKGRS